MRTSRLSAICHRSLFLLALYLALAARCAFCQSDRDVPAHQLFEQERWQQLVDMPSTNGTASPEMAYERGVALAHLERWEEARSALLAGSREAPHDKRFLLELAGVAFKQKKERESITFLNRALRIDPTDAYAHEFLATIYFLQGNTEAAVKHWNRIAKPRIVSVRSEPEPHVRPALLDHAFAFAPASTLDVTDLRASEARVESLKIFPNQRFDLLARPDGRFDTVFRGQELNGWGSTWVEGALRTFRGLPLQEITPEYYNLKQSAINLESMFRWDPDKRRVTASLSSPLGQDPRKHFRLSVDLRNENWDVLGAGFAPGTSPLLAVNMRREAVRAEFMRLAGWRWKWSAETEVSHRDFRNNVGQLTLPPELLTTGFQVKQSATVYYDLLRIPERRLAVDAVASGQVARLWSDTPQSFERIQGSMGAKWLPRARGDDLETNMQLRAGRTFGQVSFDELFMLGLERDNDLWMHGHVGTHDGRKGSAPVGRNYFLANWETDKNIYSNGFLTLRLGPLLDTGKITDPTLPAFAAQTWLWDAGAQLKVRLLGVQAGFSYGKDLRTGNNAFYATVSR